MSTIFNMILIVLILRVLKSVVITEIGARAIKSVRLRLYY